MTSDTLLLTLALCILLASAETLHGIARTTLVVPRIGKERAIQWSALTGSLLAGLICWWRVPGIGLNGALQHVLLGGVLALFMASFDIALCRWLLRKPWAKIWPDFDPRTGNYLLFGLMALAVMPLAVFWVRGL